jgi:hypothetical protein
MIFWVSSSDKRRLHAVVLGAAYFIVKSGKYIEGNIYEEESLHE